MGTKQHPRTRFNRFKLKYVDSTILSAIIPILTESNQISIRYVVQWIESSTGASRCVLVTYNR